MKKILIMIIVFSALIQTHAFAKNWETDARGMDPNGNWLPLRVDASGNLILA